MLSQEGEKAGWVSGSQLFFLVSSTLNTPSSLASRCHPFVSVEIQTGASVSVFSILDLFTGLKIIKNILSSLMALRFRMFQS